MEVQIADGLIENNQTRYVKKQTRYKRITNKGGAQDFPEVFHARQRYGKSNAPKEMGKAQRTISPIQLG